MPDNRNCDTEVKTTGLANSIYFQILEALKTLLNEGKPEIISLKTLPLTPDDLEEMDNFLGLGEIEAKIDVAGLSKVWETKFSGVWRVRHLARDEKIVVDEIVIDYVPQILLSHSHDIEMAARKLDGLLKDMPLHPNFTNKTISKEG